MNNNDLYCSKCKGHHHPVECPLEGNEIRDILEKLILRSYRKGFVSQELPKADQALSQIKKVVEGVIPKEREIAGFPSAGWNNCRQQIKDNIAKLFEAYCTCGQYDKNLQGIKCGNCGKMIKEEKMKKIGKFNLIEENTCGLKCKCGWNITIGGKKIEDLGKIKKYLKKLSKEQ